MKMIVFCVQKFRFKKSKIVFFRRMALKYEMVFADFNGHSVFPTSAKKCASFIIPSTNYTTPTVRSLFKLKDVDHSSNFKSVMEYFHVEMVNHKFFQKNEILNENHWFQRCLKIDFVFFNSGGSSFSHISSSQPSFHKFCWIRLGSLQDLSVSNWRSSIVWCRWRSKIEKSSFKQW